MELTERKVDRRRTFNIAQRLDSESHHDQSASEYLDDIIEERLEDLMDYNSEVPLNAGS